MFAVLPGEDSRQASANDRYHRIDRRTDHHRSDCDDHGRYSHHRHHANRHVFTNSPADTKVPSHWPYQELVMGWAYSPVPRFNFATGQWVQAYAPPTLAVQSQSLYPQLPAFMSMCTSADSCTPNAAADSNGTANSAGLCTAAGSHCWWHLPLTWTSCLTTCGTTKLTYTSTSTPPSGTDVDPADCRALGTASGSGASDSYGAAPPVGSIVVRSTTVASVASCTKTWTDQGSFGLKFNYSNSCNTCSQPIDYPGKIDFHQLGVGFGGHVWFSHTVPESDSAHTVVGTWTPPALNGWTKVYVHIPDIASLTQQAPYTINTGSLTETRDVDTHRAFNQWVELGVFQFNSAYPENVSLTNATADGDGTMDIAWDSVAFQPLSAKPKDIVVQMGDSYTSGEGAEPYLPGSDSGPYADQSTQSSPGETWNACHRSQNSWFRKTTLPGDSATAGTLADAFDSTLDFQSTACSGAFTTQVDPTVAGTSVWGSNGEFHEVPQVDAGYLDADTTLVALTIGGNDANFTGVIKNCIAGSGCPSDASVKAGIDGTQSKIVTVLQDIADDAPNAKIVLLGYPQLFGSGGTGCGGVFLSATQAGYLDSWASYMSSMEANAVLTADGSGSRISYWSPETGAAYFTNYRVCGPTTSGINAVVAAPASGGKGDFSCPVGDSYNPLNWICISRESFHPNNTGTSRYALVFQTALNAAGYYGQ